MFKVRRFIYVNEIRIKNKSSENVKNIMRSRSRRRIRSKKSQINYKIHIYSSKII